jgi:uncharacterized surface protein with fasciclin (FAS1) repeats
MGGFKPIAAAAALALIAPLSACSGGDTAAEQAGGEDAANRTLAAAISGESDLSTVSGALSEAGLADVFDGPGSYTILAPDDDAFDALGEGAKTLTAEDHKAELVAVLRGHILPGHLTPDAILKAIAAKKGPVTMRTLDDEQVTFSAEGKTITVTGANDTKATIDGDALVASNGVVLPINGFVKRAPAAAATPAA